MSTDNRLMIKNLQKLEHFFTITSRATNLPYAQCDETTFDDQAFLFSQEEDAADFCAKLNEDSYPSSVLRVEQNQIQKFYTGLYLTGINRVAFHNGTGFTYLPLEEIVTLKKPVQDAKTPPVINTALQLTGIYFLQELRRPGKDNRNPERLSKLREMEQELMADLDPLQIYPCPGYYRRKMTAGFKETRSQSEDALSEKSFRRHPAACFFRSLGIREIQGKEHPKASACNSSL